MWGAIVARVVFLGTPHFGIPVLEALVKHHDVVGVVTQPDRVSGRGRQRHAPPVKRVAQEYDLQILQPADLRRDAETVRALRDMRADVFVIAAYGQMLRPEVLEIPPYGCIGVHASLLPKYRGAAPVAAAILHGEEETGVTLMLTDEGMDTGPIIARRSIPIVPDDTRETLTRKLSRLGAALLIETLPAWLAGDIEPREQDDDEATMAPLISKSDGAIDWEESAVQIDRQIRAFTPWPGSFCTCDGKNFKILRAHPLPDWCGEGEPGTVVEVEEGIGVVTGEGLLILEEVQLAGRRAMEVEQFCRGRRGFVESVLGSPGQ
ncbi:MAG: methionyl-tRNA formyltransferase [Chloroflexota bacterium]|nr:methionyl-tRNA formyltransferase [Chloroflexota bacterium]